MSVEIITPALKTKLGNPTAKMILVLLADYANNDGFCFPSIRALADRAELSVRQVQRILQVFKDLDLVKKTKAKNEQYDYYFVINLKLLGSNLVKEFGERFSTVRKENVQRSQEENVQRSPIDDPRTQESVLRTFPPHPLIGVTVIEPSLNLTPKDEPSGGERFTPFRKAFEKYFEFKTGVPAPWDGKESKHLSTWLKKNPTITLDQWKSILTNRARSPVAHGKELSAWLGQAFSWVNGPTNQYGQETGNGNSKKPDKITQTTQNAVAVITRLRANRPLADEDGALAGDRGPGSLPGRLLEGTSRGG